MISYYYLAGAIVLEVCGTLLLPVTQNFTRPLQTLGMAACYLGAFYCLTFAVKVIPIAIVYAIWSGVGVFLIAIFSAFVYRQMLEWLQYWGFVSSLPVSVSSITSVQRTAISRAHQIPVSGVPPCALDASVCPGQRVRCGMS